MSALAAEETTFFEEEGEGESPMTEKEAEEVTNKLKQKEAEIKQILNDLTEEKEVNVCTWLKGVSQVVLFSQATDCKAFDEMKNKIAKSIAAYEHFERLLKNDEFLTKYKDRVDAARRIYRKYWQLLGQTSELMTNIECRVEAVLRAIKMCEKIAASTKKPPTPAVIRSCIKAINKWSLEQEKLAPIREEWQKLGDEATAEQVELRDIELETQEQMQHKKTVIKHLCLGLGALTAVALVCVGVGAIAAAVAGPVAAVLAGIASVAEIGAIAVGAAMGGALVVAGIVMGVRLRRDYLNYKCAKEGLKAMKNTADCVESIKNTMNEIATRSNKVEVMLSGLDKYWKSATVTTDELKDTMEIMNEESDAETKQFYLEMIVEMIEKVKDPMKSIQTKCMECRKEVDIAREAIVKLQLKKK